MAAKGYPAGQLNWGARMTLSEAMAAQPAWLQIWLNILLLGAFALPLSLLIWKQTRLLAVTCLLAAGLGAFGVDAMYQQLGYVKLLGLPHVILWTPLAIYLFVTWRKVTTPRAAKIIIAFILTTILISLAFDYTDVIRYALGERTPMALPAAE